MSRGPRLATLERCAVVVAGIYLAAVGVNVMTRGGVMYSNYFRWLVAAPVALVIGVILIVVGMRLYASSRELSRRAKNDRRQRNGNR